MSYDLRSVIRVFAVLLATTVAQSVMAGMPQFRPVVPSHRASPTPCNLQTASSAPLEPKSNPYSDVSGHQNEAVAIALCGSGTKRANRVGSCPHGTVGNLSFLSRSAGGQIRFQRCLFPPDPSARHLGVILRC